LAKLILKALEAKKGIFTVIGFLLSNGRYLAQVAIDSVGSLGLLGCEIRTGEKSGDMP